MAPQLSQEEEFRMLYHTLKIMDAKPRMQDLALVLGLKTATAYENPSLTKEVNVNLTGRQWRWSKLMKRLEDEYDRPGSAPATPTNNTKPKANGTKRKRTSKDKDDGEPVAKQPKAGGGKGGVNDEADAVESADVKCEDDESSEE